MDRENFRRRLGETIREARKRLGMRQEDLARAAGFEHLQTVSDIERGVRDVRAFELVRMSHVLGLGVGDLLDGRVPERPAVLWRNAPARPGVAGGRGQQDASGRTAGCAAQGRRRGGPPARVPRAPEER